PLGRQDRRPSGAPPTGTPSLAPAKRGDRAVARSSTQCPDVKESLMDRRHRSRYRPHLDVLEDRLSPGSLGHTGVLADLGPGGRHDPLAAAAAQAGALLDPSSPTTQGAQANPDVLPINSQPYGMSYGQWSAAFFQWEFSLPADHNPLSDTADLSTGQAGHVWF